MDKSTVAKMLTRLEQDGFIRKEVNQDDIRSFLVCLTDPERDGKQWIIAAGFPGDSIQKAVRLIS